MKVLILVSNDPHPDLPNIQLDGSPLETTFHEGDDPLGDYDIWLEDQIKANNPEVCDHLNAIGIHAMKDGVNLICAHTTLTCYGHIVKTHIIEAIKDAYA